MQIECINVYRFGHPKNKTLRLEILTERVYRASVRTVAVSIGHVSSFDGEEAIVAPMSGEYTNRRPVGQGQGRRASRGIPRTYRRLSLCAAFP